MIKKIFSSIFGSKLQATSLDDACVPDNAIVYVIGDIHGRADLLSQILNQITNDWQHHETKDKYLIFLGDYVDRGPQSRQVIETISNLNFPDTNIVLLMGNHEEAMLSFMEDPLNSAGWLQYGGTETLLSYSVPMPPGIPKPQTLRDTAVTLREALPETHWNFLNSLSNSHLLGDYMFVHAGVNPRHRLSDQSQHDLLWIRDAFMGHSGLFEKVIVHGHTITNTVEFMPNRISLDTGAYYSNRLSCLCLEGSSRRVIDTTENV